MRPCAGLLLMSLATVAPFCANAHAQLDRAIPPVGSIVTTPPAEIRIFFTQPVDPEKSGIEVMTYTDDRSVTTDRAIVDHTDATQMVLKLPPLADGKYRVNWHTFTTDGGDHALTGHYTFEVRR